MKMDVLEPLKSHLEERLTSNTAKKYYAAVQKLLKDQQFNNISEIKKDRILEEIQKVRGKNEFSAVKNGLKHLKEVYPDILIPTEEEFKEISSKKRNRSKKPPKKIYLDEVNRKVNQISNKKLKYAYRLAMISGLRVSELAALEKEDITFRENGIILVSVKHGKGGHGGVVECRKDKYLYEKLPDYLEELGEGKLFYSEVYMREQADHLGLECHDFRRIFAIMTRKDARETMELEEANKITMEKLRHVRFSTTKRYLFNRKLVIKEKKGDKKSV